MVYDSSSLNKLKSIRSFFESGSTVNSTKKLDTIILPSRRSAVRMVSYRVVLTFGFGDVLDTGSGPSSSQKQGGSAAAMDYSVADAISAMGGDAATGRTDGDISAILPFGIAPGAKLVMRREKMAAEQAIETGVYVTWRSLKTGEDCARVGLLSRCFCGCSYEMHHFRKGCALPVCENCSCRGFDFVPSRPEEIGEWWLPRRPGFDASSWRAKCRCGHSHEAHHPVRRTCDSCKCGEFSSAYGCVVCNSHQENHETKVENARERTGAGRAVGRDYIPLSNSPQLSELTFGRSKRTIRPPPNRQLAGVGGDKPSAAVPTATRGSGSSGVNLTLVGTGKKGSSDTAGNRTGKNGDDGTGGIPAVAVTPATATARGKRTPRQHLMSCPPTGAAASTDDFNTRSAHRSNVTQPSPELLFSSGRISASRYHEILAELDKR